MPDLIKELAKAKPADPTVDPVRMENDLARITSQPPPRSWMGAASFRRWTAPILIATAAVVVVTTSLFVLPNRAPDQAAGTTRYWHVATTDRSIVPVVSGSTVYRMQISSRTEEWIPDTTSVVGVKVSQLDGEVAPLGPGDETQWAADGRPPTLPAAGLTATVLIGPLKPAVHEEYIASFVTFSGYRLTFAELAALPGDPAGLRRVVLEGLKTRNPNPEFGEANLPLILTRLVWTPIRQDTRKAVLDLLQQVPGAQTLHNGVSLPPAGHGQFRDVRHELILNSQTWQPVTDQHKITTPQYGLPADTVVQQKIADRLVTTGSAPALPAGVPINGPLETPVIMSK